MVGAAEFVSRYDAMILDPRTRALYGATDYYNVGDWSRGARNLPRACADLVRRHAEYAGLTGATGRGWRVLDIGCGLGASTAYLAALCPDATLTGLNISAAQAAHAGAHHGGASFCVMDAERLGVADASIDCIISVEAAFHFPSRAEFLAGAYRALRPGGCLILTDILFRSAAAIGDWQVPAAGCEIAFDDYSRLCRAAGFAASIEDITAATWQGFCRHLRSVPGHGALADRLGAAVDHYLIATLRKEA
jgi:MPBQ/MSBQ methyltransferase